MLLNILNFFTQPLKIQRPYKIACQTCNRLSTLKVFGIVSRKYFPLVHLSYCQLQFWLRYFLLFRKHTNEANLGSTAASFKNLQFHEAFGVCEHTSIRSWSAGHTQGEAQWKMYIRKLNDSREESSHLSPCDRTTRQIYRAPFSCSS